MPPSAHCTPLPAQTREYAPRKPQDTLLHRLVREHYATFVAHAETTYAAPLPRYVKDAFERYLACGDYSQGFVRCHCDACRHDVLVAFSCKQRGLCPSCGARRMCDVAANVTDCILPNAPVRQWVLSLPFELSGLAATKPDVLTALGRIFAEEVDAGAGHSRNAGNMALEGRRSRGSFRDFGRPWPRWSGFSDGPPGRRGRSDGNDACLAAEHEGRSG